MGTTLTGTTPQDTYDSLIKVTDNGPLSGSLKKLTDGLGNDSSLSLSTTAASLSGTLAVSGNATFDTNTLFVDAANNRVGVGTATPNQSFEVQNIAQFNGGGVDGTLAEAVLFGNSSFSTVQKNRIRSSISAGANGNLLALEAGTATVGTYNNSQLVLRGDGNVGIGTSAPEAKLDIKGEAAAGSVGMFIENAAASTTSNSADIYFGTWGGSTVAGITNARISAVNTLGVDARTDLDFYTYDGAASGKRVSITSGGVLSLTQGQIKFPATQVASADPNTLDDYEEGTWTMGVSFGGASVGVTYVLNTGRYTKIGRQITASGYLALTSKGSSTGDAAITGLPFTSGNTFQAITPAALRLDSVSFTNAFQGYVDGPSTTISLGEVTLLGVASNLTNADFTDSSAIMVSVTYTV